MLNVVRDDRSLRFEISSERHLIGPVILEVMDYLEQYHIFNSPDLVKVPVVLRELLKNAIEHGNQEEATRTVRGHIEPSSPAGLGIEIEDEGKGFDYTTVNMVPPEDPRKLLRRGYVVINTLSDRLEFNEKGNRVTVHISLT